MKIFLLLPAYNEGGNIVPLLEKITDLAQALEPSYTMHAVVINDGSSDDTAIRVKEFHGLANLTLVDYVQNRGLGTILRAGLTTISALMGPNDAVVTMDADNTHDPALIISMLKAVKNGADIAIASRYQAGSQERGVPRLRVLLSRAGNMGFRTLFRIPHVRDYSSGFRIIRGETLKALARDTNNMFFQKTGFACMAELLLNLSFYTIRFAEVPLVLRYDLKKGASKMLPGKTIMEYISLICEKFYSK
jgi:dolichol-phosphate mannosyltransferase